MRLKIDMMKVHRLLIASDNFLESCHCERLRLAPSPNEWMEQLAVAAEVVLKIPIYRGMTEPSQSTWHFEGRFEAYFEFWNDADAVEFQLRYL